MLSILALRAFNLIAHELPRVVPLAEAAPGNQPVSIAAVANLRGPGGPYIRRDGETNPANCVAQRRLMFAFARDFGALAADREDWLGLWKPCLSTRWSRRCAAIFPSGFPRFGGAARINACPAP